MRSPDFYRQVGWRSSPAYLSTRVSYLASPTSEIFFRREMKQTHSPRAKGSGQIRTCHQVRPGMRTSQRKIKQRCAPWIHPYLEVEMNKYLMLFGHEMPTATAARVIVTCMYESQDRRQ